MGDESQGSEKERWRNFPRVRPPRIARPGPGEESVWDYPRPPRVEAVDRRVRVEHAAVVLAETLQALRVIETAGPPVYYIPPDDVAFRYLERSERTTFCEWKGLARYWSVRVGNLLVDAAAWSYPEPDAGYEAIRNHVAFHAGKVDACYVGEHRATPQRGEYYGGWITPGIVGPFKGDPGTENW